MPCRKKGGRKRKKVVRKKGKRYYRAKSGRYVRLKGRKKAPFRKGCK